MRPGTAPSLRPGICYAPWPCTSPVLWRLAEAAKGALIADGLTGGALSLILAAHPGLLRGNHPYAAILRLRDG